MLFIGNTQINLALLNPANPTGGRNYSGANDANGEILAKIAHKWDDLAKRYGPDQPLLFIRPHMKSGSGSGAMGGVYQRSVQINTNNGTKTVTWCEQAMEKTVGIYDFIPKVFTHTPEVGLTLIMSRDIEQILWHCLFDKLRERKYTYPMMDISGKPHPKGGKQVGGIYILDPNDDAADFLKAGVKSADMWYFLMSSTSPIVANRDIVNTLASAWGVSRPEEKSDAIAKQMLIQAIELAEARNDQEYGYKAFSDAVKEIISNGDTGNTETLALINRAVDRNIIKYLSSKLAWYLMTENGVEIKRICLVSASNANKFKEVLLDHLMKNEEDLNLIQGSVEAKPLKEKVGKKFYIPAKPTKEFFDSMKHPKMKSLCILIGIDQFGKNKVELAAKLTDYFVVQGKTIPPENILTEPEED